MAKDVADIAIIGAGAMGSVFAAMFASSGHRVTLVSRSGAHVDAVSASGLRLDGASGDRTVRVSAQVEPVDGPFDLVILAVKATQVVAAMEEFGSMIGLGTPVMAMQNGLGSAEIVAETLGSDRLVIGIAAAFGASVVSPGHAHHTGMGNIRMGAFAGLAPETVEEVSALWRNAGFNAVAVDDIIAMQWEKLICNASFSAPCAITGLTVSEAFADAALSPICLQAGTEAWETARACNIPVKVDDPVAYIRAFAERVAGARPSLLQDVEARRPSEIDFINGAIPREAAKVGRAAPVNETLTGLVKAIEAKR
jgi:2-dehydropantoate 2-reductase